MTNIEPTQDFTIENGVLTAYCGTAPNVVIPSGVVAIGDHAFEKNADIISVDLCNVTDIGVAAFKFCKKLKSVVAKKVVTVGADAFRFCRELQSVEFGVVEQISEFAFYDCTQLNSITGSDKLLRISNYSFASSGLPTIDLGKRLQTIPSTAFWCCGKLREIIIPDTVTEIESCAFAGCSELRHIVLPKSLRTIRRAAFQNCRFRSIVIPPEVKEIEYDAFMQCHIVQVCNMSILDIKAGKGKFGNVALHALNVYSPCSGNDLSENIDGFIFVTDAATRKHYLVDYEGTERSLVLPHDYHGDTYEINRLAFEQADITDVVLGDGVSAIGNLAFYNCKSLQRVVFGGGLKRIDRLAFKCCDKLSAVELKEGVEQIGVGAFLGTSVAYMVLPRTVTEIRSGVFDYCREIEKIYYMGDPDDLTAVKISGGYRSFFETHTLYYSDDKPSDNAHRYWHYVDGSIIEW